MVAAMVAWLARGALLLGGMLLAGAFFAAPVGVRFGGEGLLFLLLSLWLGSSFLSGSLWDRLPILGLGGLISLAAGALYFELSPPLVLTAASLVLLGWDLDLFSRRVRGFSRLEGGVVRRHLQATGLVAASGLGLALLGLRLYFSLSFGLALLLALASFATLVAILRLAR
ncbi:MAG: hypothetical protein ACUVQU_00625 [Candidatus Bipolaricaulia bacterium]